MATKCDLRSPALVGKPRAVDAEDSTMMNCANLESVPHDFNCTRSCCSWSEVNFMSTSSTIIGSCFTCLSAPVRIEEDRIPRGTETMVGLVDNF